MNSSRYQANDRAPQAAVLVLILLLTFMPFGSRSASTAYNVVIITSSDSNYQTYIATNIRDELEISGTKAIILSADDIDSALQNIKTLFVAIGERAIDSLHAFNKDAMVLRVSSRKLAGKDYTSIQSDLLTSQPDCRHIQLIKSINRDWNTVAVLSGIDSIDIAAALTKCSIAHNTNLKVYAITDNSDLLVTLEAAIEDNKVLLAISDPLIYNAHSVKNILLTAYRHRKPVIGYCSHLHTAGIHQRQGCRDYYRILQ